MDVDANTALFVVLNAVILKLVPLNESGWMFIEVDELLATHITSFGGVPTLCVTTA